MIIHCSRLARRGNGSPCKAAAARGSRTGLRFASCYVYSPRGQSNASQRSRVLRVRVKSADPVWMTRYAAQVREQCRHHQWFPWLFGAPVILVPIPAREPEHCGGPWPAERLAMALKEAGLASAVWTGLRRVEAIPKSAMAPDGERPSLQLHYRSLAVDRSLRAPERLVLVDDVVTKGRTLLAGALRLRETFPTAQIHAFALLRTLGRVADIGCLLEPCQGTIRWMGDEAYREP